MSNGKIYFWCKNSRKMLNHPFLSMLEMGHQKKLEIASIKIIKRRKMKKMIKRAKICYKN